MWPFLLWKASRRCVHLSQGEFHVGRTPIRLQKIRGRRYSHVVKHKPPPNHIMAAHQNVESHGHGPLDFHSVPLEVLSLHVLVTERLKIAFRRRMLIGGLGYEKMGTTSWHIRNLPYTVPSTFGWVCPYSHQNLVGEWHAWKLTLRLPSPLRSPLYMDNSVADLGKCRWINTLLLWQVQHFICYICKLVFVAHQLYNRLLNIPRMGSATTSLFPFSFFWHKFKIQLQKEPKIHLTQPKRVLQLIIIITTSIRGTIHTP